MLANCSPICSCDVQTNKTGSLIPVSFAGNNTRGYVAIKNLQPYTLYSFDINCSKVVDIKTYTVRTDVFRPSPPRNLELTLDSQRLLLKWKPPAFPQGPIDRYQVTVDELNVEASLKNTDLSYKMSIDHVQGTNHTFSVSACNVDIQTRSLCSDPKNAIISFYENMIDTYTSTNVIATTIPRQSASIKQFSFLLILLVFAFRHI